MPDEASLPAEEERTAPPASAGRLLEVFQTRLEQDAQLTADSETGSFPGLTILYIQTYENLQRQLITGWLSESEDPGWQQDLRDRVKSFIAKAVKADAPPITRALGSAILKDLTRKPKWWKRWQAQITSLMSLVILLFSYVDFIDERTFGLFGSPQLSVRPLIPNNDDSVDVEQGAPLESRKLSFEIADIANRGKCEYRITQIEILDEQNKPATSFRVTSPHPNMPGIIEAGSSKLLPVTGQSDTIGMFRMIVHVEGKSGTITGWQKIEPTATMILQVRKKLGFVATIVEESSAETCFVRCKLFHAAPITRHVRCTAQIQHPSIVFSETAIGSMRDDTPVRALSGGDGSTRVASVRWSTNPLGGAYGMNDFLIEMKSPVPFSPKQWDDVTKALDLSCVPIRESQP